LDIPFNEPQENYLVTLLSALAPSGLKRIKAKDIEVIVYDPALEEAEFYHSQAVNDLAAFKRWTASVMNKTKTKQIPVQVVPYW
jgi:hypothetical protein